MNIQAGDLKKRITFQKKIKGDGPFGDETYEDHKTVWAKDGRRLSKEIYGADAQNVLTTIPFYIRYRKDITSDMRVVFDGDTYEVQGKPQPVNGGKQWMIVVVKGIKHE